MKQSLTEQQIMNALSNIIKTFHNEGRIQQSFEFYNKEKTIHWYVDFKCTTMLKQEHKEFG